jgi:hypothetical protein
VEQVLDQPRTPRTKSPAPFKSDAACFSPVADRQKPEAVFCDCGKPALGGSLLEQLGSVMGKTLGLFRLFCLDCYPGVTPTITVALMYPSWKVVSNPAPGVYGLRHRTEKEQYELVQPDKK